MYCRELESRLQVWITEPPSDPDPAWTAAAESLLSDDERVRYRRFAREDDSHAFLAARVLVRRTLSRYCDLAPADWTFRQHRNGRPEIANPEAAGLRFNLSHTDGMLALLVHDDADSGVDVERLGRIASVPSVAPAVLATPEQNELTALPPEQQEAAFYRLWTLKEAFVKATGEGFSLRLKDLWFARSADGAITIRASESLQLDPGAWTFTVMRPTPQHFLATACRSGEGRPPREVELLRVSLN
jgi:4'-phosphopantetheinyl transferase